MRFPESVTILRWTVPFVMGDPPPGAEPDRIDVKGMYADAGTSEDTVSRGATVSSTATLYLPFGTNIVRTDRVEVRGRTWMVDGDPADWRSPGTNRRAGTVANLRSVRG